MEATAWRNPTAGNLPFRISKVAFVVCQCLLCFYFHPAYGAPPNHHPTGTQALEELLELELLCCALVNTEWSFKMCLSQLRSALSPIVLLLQLGTPTSSFEDLRSHLGTLMQPAPKNTRYPMPPPRSPPRPTTPVLQLPAWGFLRITASASVAR